MTASYFLPQRRNPSGIQRATLRCSARCKLRVCSYCSYSLTVSKKNIALYNTGMAGKVMEKVERVNFRKLSTLIFFFFWRTFISTQNPGPINTQVSKNLTLFWECSRFIQKSHYKTRTDAFPFSVPSASH